MMPATTSGPITHPRPASSTPAIKILAKQSHSLTNGIGELGYNAFPKPPLWKKTIGLEVFWKVLMTVYELACLHKYKSRNLATGFC